eukprot:TRINITY_DN7962_c0_g1_i12.p1 TRINITY_DN7962_c0_g1~~TRINITY_DN7962_c0_g1_i12.p1  ORF type:complete len:710 (-),score=165.67 TRINITY_DN7962_c0_g1_i12:304-2433(-)
MAHASEKKFPVSSKDYKLYEEVGEGVSATVYRALCIPFNEIVAIKVLDLEKCNNDLDGIRREVQTMVLINNPNLLKAHCSFTSGHSLWVVMPYMAGGSCLHIMKSGHTEGFEEPVIATLLREVLKALVYLHAHGLIHRDVKAGNILVDTNGAVKLADFGVSACMFDTGDRQRSRNTFAGTPCWMAPEVMQQLHGYDFKADIWSFGITALELAHGHAPFSKYPPMKVLLMTLQNAPPGLDYERDKRFSKSFKDLVAACLVKDPKKRPSSEKLLKHHFFKRARSNDFLARAILDGLPPLGERFRILKTKEADLLVQNKAMYGDKEQLSQQEYIRGISAWNFNLEDLKTQAALIQDDEISNAKEPVMNSKSKDGYNNESFTLEVMSPKGVGPANSVTPQEILPDGLHNLQNMKGSLASFPVRPLQALKGCFDVCEDDINESNPIWKAAIQSDSERLCQVQQPFKVENQEIVKDNGDNSERSGSLPKNMVAISGQRQRFLSGSLLPEHVLSSPRKVVGDGEKESQQKYQSERNYSGPLLYRQKKDISSHTSATMNNSLEDKSEGAVVQRKGRFKVTSADAGSKGGPSANCSVNPVYGASTDPFLTVASVLPSLQYILQQNTEQREQIAKMIKCVEQTSGHHTELCDGGSTNDFVQLPPASSRERDLQSQVLHLQRRIVSVVEELQMLKIKNAQLERQLSDVLNREESKRHEGH